MARKDKSDGSSQNHRPGKGKTRNTRGTTSNKTQNNSYVYKGIEKNFREDLQMKGLDIREIIGDGNCMFRALSDQLHGNQDSHSTLRAELCEFIRQNRDDFEPFIEDNASFNDHLNNLSQLGTYGGNDTLVAFSKLYNVDVIVHQPDKPVILFKAPNQLPRKQTKQIHLSYHNGEHYSSVRKIGDNKAVPSKIIATSRPTNLEDTTEMTEIDDSSLANPPSFETEGSLSPTSFVMLQSGCDDRNLIDDFLIDFGYQVEPTLDAVIELLARLREVPEDIPSNLPSTSSSQPAKTTTKMRKQEKKDRALLRNQNRFSQHNGKHGLPPASSPRRVPSINSSDEDEALSVQLSMLNA